MAATFRFTQNGYTIPIMVGVGEDSGVIIHPGRYDLNDADYIVALQQAVKAFPVAAAVEYIENQSYSYERSSEGQLRSHLYGMEDEYLAEIIDQSKLLVDQPFAKIRPYMTRYIEAVQHEIERRAIKAQEAATPPTPPKQVPGFVYLVRSTTGYYKIGRTKNPDSRIKMFEVKLPFEIELEVLIPTIDMNRLEAELHLRFADKRGQGEWFALTPEDVEYIKGLVK